MQHNLISIKRLSFHIHVPSVYGAADVQEAFKNLFYAKLMAELEELFSRYNMPDKWWQIDKLEIDIGNIDPNFLDDDIVHRIKLALQEQIAYFLGRTADTLQALPSFEPKFDSWSQHDKYDNNDYLRVNGNKQPSNRSPLHEAADTRDLALYSFAYFLQHGTLPWNYPETLSELTQHLLKNPEEVSAVLWQMGRYDNLEYIIQRLVRQFDESLLKSLVGVYYPQQQNLIAELHTDFDTYFSRAGESLSSGKWWHSIFDVILTKKYLNIDSVSLFTNITINLTKNYLPLDVFVKQITETIFAEKYIQSEDIGAAHSLYRKKTASNMAATMQKNVEQGTFSPFFATQIVRMNEEITRQKILFSDLNIVQENIVPAINKLRNIVNPTKWQPDFTAINALVTQYSQIIEQIIQYSLKKHKSNLTLNTFINEKNENTVRASQLAEFVRSQVIATQKIVQDLLSPYHTAIAQNIGTAKALLSNIKQITEYAIFDRLPEIGEQLGKNADFKNEITVYSQQLHAEWKSMEVLFIRLTEAKEWQEIDSSIAAFFRDYTPAVQKILDNLIDNNNDENIIIATLIDDLAKIQQHVCRDATENNVNYTLSAYNIQQILYEIIGVIHEINKTIRHISALGFGKEALLGYMETPPKLEPIRQLETEAPLQAPEQDKNENRAAIEEYNFYIHKSREILIAIFNYSHELIDANDKISAATTQIVNIFLDSDAIQTVSNGNNIKYNISINYTTELKQNLTQHNAKLNNIQKFSSGLIQQLRKIVQYSTFAKIVDELAIITEIVNNIKENTLSILDLQDYDDELEEKIIMAGIVVNELEESLYKMTQKIHIAALQAKYFDNNEHVVPFLQETAAVKFTPNNTNLIDDDEVFSLFDANNSNALDVLAITTHQDNDIQLTGNLDLIQSTNYDRVGEEYDKISIDYLDTDTNPTPEVVENDNPQKNIADDLASSLEAVYSKMTLLALSEAEDASISATPATIEKPLPLSVKVERDVKEESSAGISDTGLSEAEEGSISDTPSSIEKPLPLSGKVEKDVKEESIGDISDTGLSEAEEGSISDTPSSIEKPLPLSVKVERDVKEESIGDISDTALSEAEEGSISDTPATIEKPLPLSVKVERGVKEENVADISDTGLYEAEDASISDTPSSIEKPLPLSVQVERGVKEENVADISDTGLYEAEEGSISDTPSSIEKPLPLSVKVERGAKEENIGDISDTALFEAEEGSISDTPSSIEKPLPLSVKVERDVKEESIGDISDTGLSEAEEGSISDTPATIEKPLPLSGKVERGAKEENSVDISDTDLFEAEEASISDTPSSIEKPLSPVLKAEDSVKITEALHVSDNLLSQEKLPVSEFPVPAEQVPPILDMENVHTTLSSEKADGMAFTSEEMKTTLRTESKLPKHSPDKILEHSKATSESDNTELDLDKSKDNDSSNETTAENTKTPSTILEKINQWATHNLNSLASALFLRWKSILKAFNFPIEPSKKEDSPLTPAPKLPYIEDIASKTPLIPTVEVSSDAPLLSVEMVSVNEDSASKTPILPAVEVLSEVPLLSAEMVSVNEDSASKTPILPAVEVSSDAPLLSAEMVSVNEDSASKTPILPAVEVLSEVPLLSAEMVAANEDIASKTPVFPAMDSIADSGDASAINDGINVELEENSIQKQKEDSTSQDSNFISSSKEDKISENSRYNKYKELLQNSQKFEQQWQAYIQSFQQTNTPKPYSNEQTKIPYRLFDKEEGDGQEIYINNSGLILLWVYLGYFFKDLNLLDKGQFVNEQARHKAVYLLQYTATKEYNVTENFLPLNKILCGMLFDEPIATDIVLSEREKEATNKLIASAIKNWSALKSTSVDGYREAFIQREGKLTYTQEGWKLFVPPKTYDILLNYLPYGISLIRQSWMTENLWVEWV